MSNPLKMFENSGLESEYNDLKSEYDDLNTAYDSLNAEHESLESEHNDLKAKYKQLKSEHNGLKADHDYLKADYDDLKADHEKLMAAFENEQLTNATVVAEYKAEYNELQNKLSRLVGSTQLHNELMAHHIVHLDHERGVTQKMHSFMSILMAVLVVIACLRCDRG
jgi:chromosome segregation ATPase